MRTKESGVLADVAALATVAVKDLDRAKRFYEQTLGLELADKQEPGTASYQTGGGELFVYESEHAGTNKATAVTWIVGDVDGAVQSLKAKGVKFEHYDLPGMTREGDVHVADSMKAAWFKDPDGNIHALASS
jgi:catechol 2,3-dioxygenase-like lactoylglutathione lyase family enzyme